MKAGHSWKNYVTLTKRHENWENTGVRHKRTNSRKVGLHNPISTPWVGLRAMPYYRRIRLPGDRLPGDLLSGDLLRPGERDLWSEETLGGVKPLPPAGK